MATLIIISLIIAALAFLGFHSVDSLLHEGCGGDCGACGGCGGFEEPADINNRRS